MLIAPFLVLSGVALAPPDSGEAFFEARIRPALVEKCGKCHGATKQNGGLRVDSREAMLKGGDGGPALVPGDVKASRFLKAVRCEDGLEAMPPDGKLPPELVSALEQWVRGGAAWPKGEAKSTLGDQKAIAAEAKNHWAFQPLRIPATPVVKDASAAFNDVDRFLLEQQEKAGVKFAELAKRRVLIRRATYDLHGLPPAPQEIDEFLADKSPTREAFAKVVDRLLESPHYGERWGRHWLDVARYADTKGYVFQEERRYPFSYTYRDWVVDAINRDLPFDQFVTLQLAADQAPQKRDSRDLAAMGYLTVGRRFLQDVQEITDDRIDVVGRGLLGLTVTCARCHDHKFDPIPQADYYSLYGVFASSHEPKDLPEIGAKGDSPQRKDYDAKVGAKQAELDKFLAAKAPEVAKRLRSNANVLLQAAVEAEKRNDQAIVREIARLKGIDGRMLRTWLQRWRMAANAAKNTPDPALEAWVRFAALPTKDFAVKASSVVAGLEKNPKRPVASSVAEAVRKSAPKSMADVARVYGELVLRTEKEPELAKSLASILKPEAPFGVTPDVLESYLDRPARNRFTALKKELENIKATHPGATARAMVMLDNAAPMQPYVFLRGNPGRHGKNVPRQFLEVLAGDQRKPFQKGSGRLELAQAIASKDNPLTARVFVNRVWLHHFGAGLVPTPSDFGLRTEKPAQSALLDYLAAKFVADGWSQKKLHRLIMNSHAYQQGSEADDASRKTDPENRLWCRFPRQRLDWEETRDALLAAAGALDSRIGGPPVELFGKEFATRRTLYGFIDRQNLDGAFRTFDFATPDVSNAQRFVTIVPQQGLFLMNSPFVEEQARRFVERDEVASAADDQARITAMYRIAFGRKPSEEEVELGVKFVSNSANDRPDAGPWAYGYGSFDAKTKKVVGFRKLEQWTGMMWQYGPKMPDPSPKAAYLQLSAAGGHPGRDQQHLAIRRWTAPVDATVSIRGTLGHAPKKGDGVLGAVVSSRRGLLGRWVVLGSRVETNLDKVEVKAKETIDFVVSCRDGDDSDTFTWSPVVATIDAGESQTPASRSWSAQNDFRGPQPPPPGPWERYAQALFMTNEFAYVD